MSVGIFVIFTFLQGATASAVSHDLSSFVGHYDFWDRSEVQRFWDDYEFVALQLTDADRPQGSLGQPMQEMDKMERGLIWQIGDILNQKKTIDLRFFGWHVKFLCLFF